jgi:hypothetical protein
MYVHNQRSNCTGDIKNNRKATLVLGFNMFHKQKKMKEWTLQGLITCRTSLSGIAMP